MAAADAADLYQGPLDTFTARRDQLARELKAAGDAEAAKAVKALRKPERRAWALDAAVGSDPSLAEAVAGAARGVIEAQEGGDDVRAATITLREAIRALAEAASDLSAGNGRRLDPGDLVTGLLAVASDEDALEALRKARLTALPEGGGFGPMTSVAPRKVPDRSAEKRARETLRAAREDAADAHDRLQDARRLLRAAEEELRAAERSVRQLEKQVEDAERRADRADRAVDDAAAAVD